MHNISILIFNYIQILTTTIRRNIQLFIEVIQGISFVFIYSRHFLVNITSALQYSNHPTIRRIHQPLKIKENWFLYISCFSPSCGAACFSTASPPGTVSYSCVSSATPPGGLSTIEKKLYLDFWRLIVIYYLPPSLMFPLFPLPVLRHHEYHYSKVSVMHYLLNWLLRRLLYCFCFAEHLNNN